MQNLKSITKPLVILLVEDEPTHADLIMHGLHNLKVENVVYHVSDGDEALEYLRREGIYSAAETSPKPQVILLDLRMTRVDGLEVLKAVKESEDLCEIPIVVLTSSDAEKDIAAAYSLHTNSYLVKPVDFADFGKLMDDLGFYWLGWNRCPLAIKTVLNGK